MKISSASFRAEISFTYLGVKAVGKGSQGQGSGKRSSYERHEKCYRGAKTLKRPRGHSPTVTCLLLSSSLILKCTKYKQTNILCNNMRCYTMRGSRSARVPEHVEFSLILTSSDLERQILPDAPS